MGVSGIDLNYNIIADHIVGIALIPLKVWMSDLNRPLGADELLSTKLAAPHLRTPLVTL